MAHPDLDRLLNTLLQEAKALLATNGEFFPFACAMQTDGQVTSEAAYDAERSDSQSLINMLTQALKARANAGQIRASGICYDVRILPPGRAEKSDAICVGLEHYSGESVSVYLPYIKDPSGEVHYEDLCATSRHKQIF
jgi:hypothetical protein